MPVFPPAAAMAIVVVKSHFFDLFENDDETHRKQVSSFLRMNLHANSDDLNFHLQLTVDRLKEW